MNTCAWCELVYHGIWPVLLAARLLGQGNRAHTIELLHRFRMTPMVDELVESDARELTESEMSSLVSIVVRGRAIDAAFFCALSRRG